MRFVPQRIRGLRAETVRLFETVSQEQPIKTKQEIDRGQETVAPVAQERNTPLEITLTNSRDARHEGCGQVL